MRLPKAAGPALLGSMLAGCATGSGGRAPTPVVVVAPAAPATNQEDMPRFACRQTRAGDTVRIVLELREVSFLLSDEGERLPSEPELSGASYTITITEHDRNFPLAAAVTLEAVRPGLTTDAEYLSRDAWRYGIDRDFLALGEPIEVVFPSDGDGWCLVEDGHCLRSEERDHFAGSLGPSIEMVALLPAFERALDGQTSNGRRRIQLSQALSAKAFKVDPDTTLIQRAAGFPALFSFKLTESSEGLDEFVGERAEVTEARVTLDDQCRLRRREADRMRRTPTYSGGLRETRSFRRWRIEPLGAPDPGPGKYDKVTSS